MNVLSLIDTGGPGGAETVFLRLATRLDRTRFQSIAAIGREGWLAERLREGGLEPRIVPASGSFNIGYLSSLVRLIRRTGTDLVLAHLYGSAIYASLAGMLTGVPVVSVLHGQSDVNPRERFGSAKAAIVRKGSKKVVCVSDSLREEIARRLKLRDSRCAVIPNGVDVAAFQPGRDRSIRAALNLADDVLLIGAIGNVRAPKAYDVLLQAAAILVRRSVRVHLVIAGEVSGTVGRELLDLRLRLGLESHATFLGLRSDVATVLHNLDIFVLSSLTEGFSIACIEAMACGVPVVATRSGGPQQILDERTGILVTPGRPEELADALEQLVHNSSLRERFALAGPTRVREHFSLDRMVGAYEALLTELCLRKRA